MAGKKSQSSVELIVIVGISMVILFLSSILLLNYAKYSTGNILYSRVNQIGNSMVTNANIVYTYGPPAKVVIEYNFPPLINDISVVNGHLLIIHTSILSNSTYSGFDSPANITAVFTQDDFTEGKKRFVIEAHEKYVEIRRLFE
jgi:hypothetical protein